MKCLLTIIILAILGLLILGYLFIKIGEKEEKLSEKQISELCVNFSDALNCDKAVKEWEERIKGSEVYGVFDYEQDGKSAFKEGWILYMRLNEPLLIPQTDKKTFRIGLLIDKNSDSSQIYEFVE